MTKHPNETNADVLGIGLDCSGLVMNCLLDMTVANQALFQDIGKTPTTNRYEESAADMGSRRCRIIPLDKRSGQNIVKLFNFL